MAAGSLFAPTYSVSQLGAEIRELLRVALPAIWVAGEVQRLRPTQRGHVYFELVEKGEDDAIVGKLDAVVWKNDYLRLRPLLERQGQRLADGLEIRCQVGVDFYPPGGRLQLVVREIDPTFALGRLELRRRETLAALAEAGLVERNRALPLPALPLRLGLVTSAGSAAYHDFLATLAESGFGFQVLFVHAAMQGREAESEVRSALALLGQAGVDAIALVRGGGARTDLAAFDSRAIAEAVALAPVPVLTGLGHEIDQSVADLVAHSAAKTPTKAAELLVERLRGAELAWQEGHLRLRRGAGAALERPRRDLDRAGMRLRASAPRIAAARAASEALAGTLARLARLRLASASHASAALGTRLAPGSRRALERGDRAREAAGARLIAAGRARLATVAATVAGLARLAQGFAPERVLARGFSLTRSADGRLLRDPAAVQPGERLASQLFRGTLWSVVEG